MPEAGRLIVDGMNVIGSRPDGWWRDRRGAMRSLVGLLASHAEAEGEAMTVIFDGRPFEIDRPETGSVEVLFASRAGPNAADDDPARRVREEGAELIGAGAFRRRLDGR